MACHCHLKKTILKLYGGEIPVELLSHIDAADLATKDDYSLEDHMLIEERYIFPYLDLADKRKLFLDHTMFRGMRSAGIEIPKEQFEAHATHEEKVFPLIKIE